MLKPAGAAELEPFWNDVDPDVAEALDPLQKEEIQAAIKRRATGAHVSDVRLSFFGYFLVVLFGRERRSKERRESERANRPVFTVRNLPLIVLVWGSLIYTAFSVILPGISRLLDFML